MARVPWEESLLAWQADFTEESYWHLRDIYADLYDAVIARGRHQPIPIHQRAQAAAQGAAGQATTPAQPQQQPSAPSSPSSTTTVSTIKAAAPSTAQTQAATGPGDQAAAPSAAVPSRTTTESPSRPSSYPPATASRGRYTAAGRSSSRRKRTPPARRDSLPLHRCGRRRPDAQDPELPSGLQLQAAGSRTRTRSSNSSTPPARASLSGRPLWTAQGSGSPSTDTRVPHNPRVGRRTRHPQTSRTTSQTRIGIIRRGQSPLPILRRAEHYNRSDRHLQKAVYSGRAAFNPDRVYEAEQVSIKRPAPAGRDSSTAPATKTARIVFAKRGSQVKAPPQSVITRPGSCGSCCVDQNRLVG